ncbi:MAG: hypothetical protein KAR13_13870 [Desulfobulbaceae bacterium]|nr:hypothetical protein [Desulfobulbaceae bacterium]
MKGIVFSKDDFEKIRNLLGEDIYAYIHEDILPGEEDRSSNNPFIRILNSAYAVCRILDSAVEVSDKPKWSDKKIRKLFKLLKEIRDAL